MERLIARLSRKDIENWIVGIKKQVRIQVSFEIELEKRLRIEGFTPDCINQYRNQLRELFFYDNSYQGKRIKISDLENLTQEMKDMSKNFIDSQPWEIISKARDNLDLFLYKPNEFKKGCFACH